MRLLVFVLLFMGCTPQEPEMLLGGPDDPEALPDIIPAVQPFVNEGCNTAWDNLSAIIDAEGNVTYFEDLPEYTSDPFDYDKSRFTFVYQAKNPWYGVYEDENPYARMQTGWKMLPIDDYGALTCQGLQEIRIWILDENTDRWYMNSQVVLASLLCNGQDDCDQGYGFAEIEFVQYEPGYLYLQDGVMTEQ